MAYTLTNICLHKCEMPTIYTDTPKAELANRVLRDDEPDWFDGPLCERGGCARKQSDYKWRRERYQHSYNYSDECSKRYGHHEEWVNKKIEIGGVALWSCIYCYEQYFGGEWESL
eukprot:SAG11_NODE_7251_length_1172_cov_5.457596_2_plen_115_part_00